MDAPSVHHYSQRVEPTGLIYYEASLTKTTVPLATLSFPSRARLCNTELYNINVIRTMSYHLISTAKLWKYLQQLKHSYPLPL